LTFTVRFVGVYVTQESLRSANRTWEIQKDVAVPFSQRIPTEYGITLFIVVAALLLGVALGKFAL